MRENEKVKRRTGCVMGVQVEKRTCCVCVSEKKKKLKKKSRVPNGFKLCDQ